ncbi:hypothetical protein [Streptomyces rochei]|uniref:hypothetical protein n=1 Tax=Streptomyces rochei TaxID=1928 RepID=UPI00362895AE
MPRETFGGAAGAFAAGCFGCAGAGLRTLLRESLVPGAAAPEPYGRHVTGSTVPARAGAQRPRALAAVVTVGVVDQEREEEDQGEHDRTDCHGDDQAGVAVFDRGLHGVAFRAQG